MSETKTYGGIAIDHIRDTAAMFERAGWAHVSIPPATVLALLDEMAQQFQVMADLVRERDAAREEVARLRAALERYADASNWSPHAEYCGCLWTGSAEGAEIARNILEAPDAD